MKVEDILRELGVPYLQHGAHHHSTPGRLQIDCPFCSPRSKRWRMGIKKDKNSAACWTCGWHSFTDVLKQITGWDGRRVQEYLKPVIFVQGKKTPQVNRGTLVVPKAVTNLLPVHRDYLTSRGYDPDQLATLWGIKGIGLAARLAWRIFIPIFVNGEMVSWTTRAVVEDTKRYINARADEEILPAKNVVGGEDYCRSSIIIHEGPFDAFRTGPGATWLGGLEWTRAQILAISKYPVRVICFDNEKVAQRRARLLLSILESFPGETHNVILEGKDPGSAPEEEIKALRRRFLE